eukprot:351301-Chlamydomonas_euryale.AAC.2
MFHRCLYVPSVHKACHLVGLTVATAPLHVLIGVPQGSHGTSGTWEVPCPPHLAAKWADGVTELLGVRRALNGA